MTRKTNTQLAAEAKAKHDKYTRKAKEAAVANDNRWKTLRAAARLLDHIADAGWAHDENNCVRSALEVVSAAADRIAGLGIEE